VADFLKRPTGKKNDEKKPHLDICRVIDFYHRRRNDDPAEGYSHRDSFYFNRMDVLGDPELYRDRWNQIQAEVASNSRYRCRNITGSSITFRIGLRRAVKDRMRENCGRQVAFALEG
jgi:hypothetical protein